MEAGVAVDWSPAQLSQLAVLGLSFQEDGDIRVGIFPQGEEILVGAAGLGGPACLRVGAAQPQPRKRMYYRECINTAVVDNLLELSGRFACPPQTQIRLSAEVD